MARYSAFISYSHAADGRFAPGLKAGLQRFAKPWFKLRALKIFLDGANLNLSPHLWSAIERALSTSDHFLYLASPQAAASKWVQQELAWWASHRSLDQLLIVVTAGELAWDDAATDFDWARTDCIPQVLSRRFGGEPFFLDLRWARSAQDLSVQNPRFQQAIALLSATLQGKAVEDLVGEEVEQHRRTTRLRNGVIGSLTLLLLATAAAAVMALRESSEARRQQQEALRQRDHALAAALRNRVQSDLDSGALAEATRWVLTGLQRFGADAAVQQAAMNVATHSRAVLTTIREPAGSAPRAEFSPDGSQFLVLARSPLLFSRARLFALHGPELQSFDRVTSAAFLPGGQRLKITEMDAYSVQEEADGSACGSGYRLRLVSTAPATQPVAPGVNGAAGVSGPAGAVVAMGLQAFSADGQNQLSVCGNYLRWGSTSAAAQRWRLPGIVAAALSPDERWVAAVMAGKTRLLPVGPAPARAAASGPVAGVAPAGIDLEGVAPVFAREGDRMATVQAGHTLLWDLDGRPRARLRGTGPVFGPGGMVLTQHGGASWLWREGVGPVRLEGTEARISPDGRWVMTTLDATRTRVAAADGHELVVLEGTSGRFAPGAVPGLLALTATSEGLVRLWDLRRAPASTPEAAERLWGLAAGELSALAPRVPGQDGCNRDLSLVCSADGLVRVATSEGLTGNRARAEWRFLAPGQSFEAAQQRAVWEGPAKPQYRCLGPLANVVFSAAGEQLVAFGCGDGLVRVFSRDGSLRWERQQAGAVQKLAFGPDGTFLITASADGVSRIWNASSGEPVAQINGHESDIAAVVLGPAYALAATLSSQGVLRLWRLDGPRGALAATIRLDEDLIEATTFSPDGNWLLGRTRSGRWHRWLAQPSALAQQYPWLAGLSRAEQDELGPGR